MNFLLGKQRSLGLAIASLSLALPVNATANALEEVIVTAQKREQSLQEAPIAMSAFTTQALDEMKISSIEGLAGKSPNVIVVPTVGGSVNAGINIRGASSTVNNLSRDAAVGVYLDGVPIAKASGAIFDVADLERIEVLRGPQGTLYGKNTIGGAINLITARPTGNFGGTTTVTYGNENLRILRAHIDTPSLGESGEGAGKVAAKVSYFRKLRDGFVENEHPSSKDFDNQNQWSTRLALNWELNDKFSADYAYDRFELDQRPTALQIVELGSYRTLPGFGAAASAAYSPDRRSSIANDASLESTVAIRGHTLTLNYDIGSTAWLGDVSLKYIGARRTLDTDSLTDFDGTAADFSRFGLFNEFEQTTHEVQWIGESDDISYVLGLFYYKDEWSTDNPRWNAQMLRGMDGVFETNQRDAVDDSTAAFGQLDWRANDWLELTFGLRWTRETKDVNRLRVTDGLKRGTSVATNPASGVFVRNGAGNAVFDAAGNYQALNASKSFSEVTPLLVASFHINQDVNIYLKYATGFKSGGYNDVASTNAEFLQGFDAETMTTYELGLKSLLFKNRVQVNAAVFYNDYKDYQADVYVPEALGIGVQNAAKATSSGVELEISALLVDDLELTLNYGYLDFKFDEYLTPDNYDINHNGNRAEIIDVKGARDVPYNMRHNASAGLRYSRDVGIGTALARLDYSFRDRHYFSGDPATSLKPQQYGLWNARIGLDDIKLGGERSLSVDFWCRNLFDKEYIVSGFVYTGAYPVQGMAVGTFGDPRSFGVDVKFAF
jgi:iron complex outermembrane recepter protein